MTKFSFSNFLIFALIVASLVGCKETSVVKPEELNPKPKEVLSIESQTCSHIVAVLPDRGRYDGVSLGFYDDFNHERWEMRFTHVSETNETFSDIGLLSLDEIAKIAKLILNQVECRTNAGPRNFKSGDKLYLSVDLWLVEDLYKTVVAGTRIFTQRMQGEMTTKPLRYHEVDQAFESAGFADKICNQMQEAGFRCSSQPSAGCEKGLETKPKNECTAPWSSVNPVYSNEVKGLPMKEVCSVESCGLKKESKFNLYLVKR